MKSIRNKILVSMLLSVFISLAVVGGASAWLSYRSTIDTLRQAMIETGGIASERITQELAAYKDIASVTGCIPELSESGVSVEAKRGIINQQIQAHGLKRGNIIGSDGISILDGMDYTDRAYVQSAMKGRTDVSEPLVSKVTGELSIMISAPIWEGGVPGSKVWGVVYFVPTETFLNDIVADIKISPHGGAYILDKEGYTIAHENIDNVKNRENTQAEAGSDKKLNQLAALEKRMSGGESGFGEYQYNGAKKFLSFSPIDGKDGWSLGVNAPASDFTYSAVRGIIITFALMIVFLAGAAVVAYILAKRIGDPVRSCAARLRLLAEGDLDTPVMEVHTKDETKVLSDAAMNLVGRFNTMIKDMDYMLAEMAGGNMGVDSQCEEAYTGGYKGLLESARKLNQQLSAAFSQINRSAEQVSAGAQQVSAGAQALSQGATEQAGTIEELASAVNDISEKIQTTAANASDAHNQTSQTGKEVEQCNLQMLEMVEAVKEIGANSVQIGKIIKTIEDIAFQTNVLALNAAVEAARAGAAGKGFAVVADEVRNLAGKSAEASKSTSELIEQAARSVEKGVRIADETAMSLLNVMAAAEDTEKAVDMITNASGEQSAVISQVTVGMDQISNVVQTNSATAQESAAASEELSGQAEILKNLVGQFKTKQS